jgi:DNA processing protein
LPGWIIVPRMSDEIMTIGSEDPRYPPLLRLIPDRPERLYVRGSAAALVHALPIAVVGTRSMSRYGESAVAKIVGPMAAAGAAVISGLALGVDAAAHEAALAAAGITVAVLAASVDRDGIGPKANARLAERIVSRGGALVSEHPPGTPAHKGHFPLRNRIIAGMSKATVVIEAPTRSGALITAKAALDYDREVFAVPGPITYPSCEGANALIASGASPACAAGDILGHYGLSMGRKAARPADPTLAKVLMALDAPTDLDVLAARTGLPTPAILAAVTALELDGRVSRADAGWVRTS